VLHYKTCSTFDSAPHIGSIGAAVRALRGAVEQPWTAIVGGQPNLGRHCLFGNLFAAAGAGGEVFRIDRHPTMSRHPVTPMHEADLRLHLAGQGLADVRSIPFTVASKGAEALGKALQRTLHAPSPSPTTPPEAVLFDVADAAQLAAIGKVLWAQALRDTLLAVGPSSVVDALATALGTRADAASAPPVVSACDRPRARSCRKPLAGHRAASGGSAFIRGRVARCAATRPARCANLGAPCPGHRAGARARPQRPRLHTPTRAGIAVAGRRCASPRARRR
jgi:hypothetical protein